LSTVFGNSGRRTFLKGIADAIRTEGKRGEGMGDTKKQALPVAETPEIVELDEHLDMASDPLWIVTGIIRSPTHNVNCWCPPPR
jgi:hypothetical protein